MADVHYPTVLAPARELQHVEEVGSRFSWRLFMISCGALYIELVLIRWIGTEVRVFAFFQNLALIACFLGFGLGCYWSERHMSILRSMGAMTALVVLVTIPFGPWQMLLRNISNLLSLSPDAALWGFGAYRWSLAFYVFSASILLLFLLLIVMAMVPFGQWIGKLINSAQNTIRAYSANLVGSLVGTWLLAAAAFLYLPPVYWFALAFLLLALTFQLPRRDLLIATGMLAVIAFCLLNRERGFVSYWSPYQKLQVYARTEQQYVIGVNNTGYMTVANVTPEFRARHSGFASNYGDSSYDSPFRFATRLDRVLILGSGAGNDAAAAFRNGAHHVDAVEIDPLIYSLGKRLHPEHPYSSPNVNVIVNDARNFLRETQNRYDVIVFALLDSHTEFSSYSNMRVDNYVYTEEALRQASRLLNPHGILILKFEVRPPWTWIGQRLFAMMEHAFSRPPITYFAPDTGMLPSATVFIESWDPTLWDRAAQPELRRIVTATPNSFPENSAATPVPTSDDWPYIYHRSRTIPRTYLSVSLILLVLATLLVRPVLKPKEFGTWHFFLLGAGFLLLETQMINRLALFFGTTWIVNSIALTLILGGLVLANVYVEWRQPRHLQLYFVALLVSLSATYVIKWGQLPLAGKTVGVLLGLAFGVPLFLSGIIFTESLRRCPIKSNALGANIVGAVAGGLAQNLSFIYGMRSLLIVALAFYAAALVVYLIALRPEGFPGPASIGFARR